MICQDAEVLLHALLDDELDAGHAREVEAHLAGCRRCAQQLRDYRDLCAALSSADLRLIAPAALRRRIEAALPAQAQPATSRRAVLKGFALGTMLSSAAAASFVFVAMRGTQEQHLLAEVLSAHLRSLQGDHLTDVQSSDQHTVKPWFNGRIDVAPPVFDLAAQGFTLLGGRLDFIDGRKVAAIAYRRRNHVINLFVSPETGPEHRAAGSETVQGFNIRRWSGQGLGFVAISDLNAEELNEFRSTFEAAARAGA